VPSDYIRLHLPNVRSLRSVGPVHFMRLYGTVVNFQFRRWMHERFGDSFRSAPVKNPTRMINKTRSDIVADVADGAATLLAAFDGGATVDVAAATEVQRRFFQLADVVRGSITATGADEIAQVVATLRNSSPTSASEAGLVVWRIKNTHHVDAKVVGGYVIISSSFRHHSQVDFFSFYGSCRAKRQRAPLATKRSCNKHRCRVRSQCSKNPIGFRSSVKVKVCVLCAPMPFKSLGRPSDPNQLALLLPLARCDC
jgi:hypothetical protein